MSVKEMPHEVGQTFPLIESSAIMIVDDSSLIRRIQRRTLSEYGAHVSEAANGQEALDRLREAFAQGAHVDLVMIDLGMPVMDGLTLLTEIRTDPTLRSLPVIIVSSEDNKKTVLECARHGVSGFVSKDAGKDAILTLASKAIASARHSCKRPQVTLNQDEIRALLQLVCDTELECGDAEDLPITAQVEAYLRRHCPAVFVP